MNATWDGTHTFNLPIISDGIYYVAMLALNVVLLVLNIAGGITNVINMLVFIRQGLTSDSITVSLFAMSVSDLLSSIFMFPWLVCFFMGCVNPSSQRNNYCNAITSLAASIYHVIFTRVTCFIQTYISVERAFSVVFPLRVKNVIKTRNTVIINLVLCLVIFAIFAPYLANIHVVWGYNKFNVSVAAFVENSEGKIVPSVISGFVIPNAAIVVNSLATVVIVYRLSVMRKWRENVSASHYGAQNLKSQGITSKNIEASKTVIVITSIYVINLICNQLHTMFYFTFPEVSQEGLNKNLYFVLYIFRFILETLHSTTNVVCYLKMSTKYRLVFHAIFSRRQSLIL
ncbi:thyrotropin-releasing hormone receptor [Biomphalaria glabrata]|nr:thyrotropin-releasing hormone receptor [Biomphalaria glabrata]